MTTDVAPLRRDRPRSAAVREEPAPDGSFWRAAANGAFVVTLLAVLALAVALAVVPRVMGGAALTVLSGSMEPTYSAGDMVVSVPQERYAIGDVVTFQPEPGDPTLITHRIVTVRDTPQGIGYVTRGDANGADDAPIVAEQVMGKVIYAVPYIGYAAEAVGEHRTALIVVAGSALIGYAVYVTGSALLVRKRTRESASTQHTQGD